MSADAQAATVTENGVSPAAQENKIEEAPGFKVFAGNLAYTTTDDGLRAFFAPVESDILSAQVILRGTRSAGYGFVALSTAEAAQKAVELLDKKELDGRTVIVEIAKPSDQKDKERKERRSSRRRPGRRGAKAVPGEVTDAEANGEPPKTEDAAVATPGTDEAAKPKKKKRRFSRKPRSKAAPPTAGESAEGAAPAASAEANGAEASAEPAPRKARKSKPRAPRPPRPEGEAPAGEPSTTVLFVANLGFNIDDEGLQKLFTDAGIAVTSARVVRRRYGRPRKSKGYGFVDVGNEEEQKKAIAALEGKDVDGRPIAVKVAVNSGNNNNNNPDDAADAVTDADAAAAPVADTSAATA